MWGCDGGSQGGVGRCRGLTNRLNSTTPNLCRWNHIDPVMGSINKSLSLDQQDRDIHLVSWYPGPWHVLAYLRGVGPGSNELCRRTLLPTLSHEIRLLARHWVISSNWSSLRNDAPMLSFRKELALLKHPVKLRRSCAKMIIPDIRKRSKADQIMGANKYSR